MTDLADLPTGTVTFLFTDLEGSTALLEAHPEAYRDAVRRHHDLLRGAVEGHGGVVFETVGDAVYAAFARPTDAVAAALAGQLALQREDWGELGAGAIRARMGLHTGEVEAQGAHYFGAPLYRCARLMATAHGGQVVLSAAAAEVVRDALPAEVGLRDLGEHRLKDLQRPEQVFQLLYPELPGEFLPLRSLEARPHNLPLQLTSFVGRERELAEVAALLGTQRLVTLTGPGGTGKTRLALQAAANALEAYPDGVWFVELAPLADPALGHQAVAAAVGVREEPGRPLATTLAEALRSRNLLLLLDNCEHLLEVCANLADTLLRASPRLRVLATSREPLGIAGETAWRVPSLGLPPPPDARHPPPVEALTQYEAVRLFIDRALAGRPDFAVTNQNAPAVAQVCARLDGIPLALELAAARVRVLPPEQLLARLEDRFRLLTGGSRTALPRQQTLRAAVDWSYDLLTDQERALFGRLAVFAGGFTLEAAEAVCTGDGLQIADVLELLTRLADKSLVVVEDPRDGAARYRLLETLRQYGRERLAAGGATDAVRERHAAHFLAVIEAVPSRARTGPGEHVVAWSEAVEREHANLRAALAWWLDTGQAEPALRLAAALGDFWALGGHYGEGRRWLEAGLAAGGAVPLGLRAAALNRAGLLAHYQGDYARARELHEAAVAAQRKLGDRLGAAHALQSLGFDLWLTGAAGRAVALMEESLAVFRAHDNRFAVSRSLRDLGLVALSLGQYARAAALFAESVDQARAAGLQGGVVRGLSCLGRVAHLQGEHRLAAARLAEALTMMQRLGSGFGQGHHAVADCLEWVAAVAGATGQPARAARLFGAAEALRAASGTLRYEPERPAYDRDVAAARARLGEPAFAAAWAEGRAMTPEQAVADALADAPEDAPAPA